MKWRVYLEAKARIEAKAQNCPPKSISSRKVYIETEARRVEGFPAAAAPNRQPLPPLPERKPPPGAELLSDYLTRRYGNDGSGR